MEGLRTSNELRRRLYELSAELNCDELRQIATELGRRKSIKRAPRQSRPTDEQLNVEIINYVYGHPYLTQAKVAQVFNVNPGRVSEALRGKR